MNSPQHIIDQSSVQDVESLKTVVLEVDVLQALRLVLGYDRSYWPHDR